MDKFIQRHTDRITGVIFYYDRVVLTGTIPKLCHASAMARFLRYKGIRIFDYPKWAEPLREDICVHAEAVAKDAGLKIDFIRSQTMRCSSTPRRDSPMLHLVVESASIE